MVVLLQEGGELLDNLVIYTYLVILPQHMLCLVVVDLVEGIQHQHHQGVLVVEQKEMVEDKVVLVVVLVTIMQVVEEVVLVVIREMVDLVKGEIMVFMEVMHQVVAVVVEILHQHIVKEVVV